MCVFVLHVAEEFMTGFHREMPALFGFAGWSDRQFLTFNAIWLLIFVRAAIVFRPVSRWRS